MIFYFKITKNIQFRTRKFQKNKFYASFQFYFLCIFLVRGNLVSKYEQLLILTGIDASALVTGMVPLSPCTNCTLYGCNETESANWLVDDLKRGLSGQKVRTHEVQK
jgi:hypothetical protein